MENINLSNLTQEQYDNLTAEDIANAVGFNLQDEYNKTLENMNDITPFKSKQQLAIYTLSPAFRKAMQILKDYPNVKDHIELYWGNLNQFKYDVVNFYLERKKFYTKMNLQSFEVNERVLEELKDFVINYMD